MPRVVTKPVEALTPTERKAVMRLMGDAFELIVPVEQVMNHYCSTIRNIFLAYEGGEVIGFQFYQDFEIDGVPVCQFSLAGKAPRHEKKGLQRAFGTRLMLQSMGRVLNPFRRFAIVGVSNNPKTYRNMLLIGGEVFPDVTRPHMPFKYTELYRQVAERLGIRGLDVSTGLVKDRCASLGFRMKQTAFHHRDDPIHEGFLRYIDGDTNHGIFTMVVSTLLASIPTFLARCLGLKG